MHKCPIGACFFVAKAISYCYHYYCNAKRLEPLIGRVVFRDGKRKRWFSSSMGVVEKAKMEISYVLLSPEGA